MNELGFFGQVYLSSAELQKQDIIEIPFLLDSDIGGCYTDLDNK